MTVAASGGAEKEGTMYRVPAREKAEAGLGNLFCFEGLGAGADD